MMKEVLLIIALALFPLSANAKPNTQEFCDSLSNLVSRIAQARDYAGVDMGETLYRLIEGGIPESMALSIVELVYLEGKDYTPEELANFTQVMCLSLIHI